MDKNVQIQVGAEETSIDRVHNIFPVTKASAVKNMGKVARTNDYEDLANKPGALTNEEILAICQ